MVVTEQKRIKTEWAPCGRRENRQDYYLVRAASSDYTNYWGQVTDPDGKVRFRDTPQEKRQHQADLFDEAAFINSRPDILSILDFGAGLGWFLEIVTCPIKAAVEIAPQAVEALRALEIPVYGSLSEVSSNSFGCVFANHVFEHLDDPIGAINHIRRILHPGGYLVLGTPDFNSPCARRFGENYRLLSDQTHCSLFTLESMTRMLRDHALEIIDVRFPFPDRYATAENFLRWNDTSKVSPPWPGNFVTWYTRRA